MRIHALAALLAFALLTGCTPASKAPPASTNAVSLIYDTDMGNDVDDALAMGVIHSLQTRGQARLLAVTITKDHEFAAPFVDVINTFYGRGDVPIGVVRKGPTTQPGKFNHLANVRDGKRLRYPHDLKSGKDAPEAVALLRKVLAAQPDNSVAMVQVGFATNFARLLDSPADAHSPMDGKALVAKKVRFLSTMFGAFQPIKGKPHREYNVIQDLASAKKLVQEWPTPVVFSGYEIGIAITYPAESIERDYAYVKHHPLPEAYVLYNPPPHNRPNWDLTSVLYAVLPDRGYFGLSEPGKVTVDEKGLTQFQPSATGTHRYLTVTPEQIARTREALVNLASQPPCRAKK